MESLSKELQQKYEILMNWNFNDNPKSTEIHTFQYKLMKQNDWTKEYTQEVINEYKKYMFLILIIKMVAPPYEIDQVWHFHILHTKNYMDMCKKVFGKFIHHDPASSDEHKSECMNTFDNTVKEYRTTYNQNPPRHIWFDPNTEAQLYTVNKNTHFIIKIPQFVKTFIKYIKTYQLFSQNSCGNCNGKTAASCGNCNSKQASCGNCNSKKISCGNCNSQQTSCGNCNSKQTASCGNCNSKQASCGNCNSKQASCGNCNSKQASCGNCNSKQASCGNCNSKQASCGNCNSKQASCGNCTTKQASCGNCSTKQSSCGNCSSQQ